MLGAVAGGLAGALVMWSRRPPPPGSRPLRRRGLILLSGSGSVGVALLAYGKAFGPDTVIQGALVSILVTAWLAILGAVVRLPIPARLLRALPGEPALLMNPWSGVPAFGALLKRTPLRRLGGPVFLAAASGDPRKVREAMVAAQGIHLWALVGSVPWIVRWAILGRWAPVGAALLVHGVLNLAPVLHLRLAIWRTEGCQRWRERRPPARPSP